ncbi:MAG TPA: polysaccharide biosynthesis protein [Symbiobacteriaceae bacterium]
MSRRESLLRGAAALAVAGLIIKISNLLVRVPLAHLVGSEGLGMYQMALPAFFAFFHVASGGVPVAVQNLVAEAFARDRPRMAQQVFRLAFVYTLLAGGLGSAALLAGAPRIARMLGEPRVQWSLMALSPAVILFALDSLYRNYLQGRNLMTPSATGSVLEQAAKVVVTMGASSLLMRWGKEFGAAGAALGITAGAVLSLLYVAAYTHWMSRRDPADDRPGESAAVLARRMAVMAWPVTLGSIAVPLLNLVDVGIVQRGFQKAFADQSLATAMYGAYSGIALQVVWFPQVLTNALGNALAPVLAAARARNDRALVRERIVLGIRATGLICLPAAVGLALLADPVARVFGEPGAAVPLRFLAPVAYLGPLFWMMTAQLQALGQTGIPMRNFGLSMGAKLLLDALAAPVPGFAVEGVALATVAMFLTGCWLNARALARQLDEPLPWALLLEGPLISSLLMGAVLFGLATAGLMPSATWASLSTALAVAPVAYGVLLVITRAVTWADLREMGGPWGTRLERWFHSFWN